MLCMFCQVYFANSGKIAKNPIPECFVLSYTLIDALSEMNGSDVLMDTTEMKNRQKPFKIRTSDEVS